MCTRQIIYDRMELKDTTPSFGTPYHGSKKEIAVGAGGGVGVGVRQKSPAPLKFTAKSPKN